MNFWGEKNMLFSDWTTGIRGLAVWRVFERILVWSSVVRIYVPLFVNFLTFRLKDVSIAI